MLGCLVLEQKFIKSLLGF